MVAVVSGSAQILRIERAARTLASTTGTGPVVVWRGIACEVDMKNRVFIQGVLCVACWGLGCQASAGEALTSPAQGVLCDRSICADAKGISFELTFRYLGKAAGDKLMKAGRIDTSQFTFANGLFCDAKERVCRKDRFFKLDGTRSDVVPEYSKLLFPDATR